MVVIEIPFRDALALRRGVLRPEAPSDDATIYDEELEGTAATYGVVVDQVPVAIGTVMPDGYPPNPGPGDWRIRGMATNPDFRGRGLGALVLSALVAHAIDRDGTLAWCNARVSAAAFYEGSGFVRRGDIFNTAGDRPHLLMDRPLSG